MHILFLSQYFHPEPFSNNTIATELVRRGHSVNVVCCVPNYPSGTFYPTYSNRERRSESWSGVTINRAWTYPRGKSNLSLLINYLVYPATATWTALRKNKSGADVSFVSMPSPAFQALVGIAVRWIRRTPTVFWVQDIWPESALLSMKSSNPVLNKALHWFCRWMYRRADFILVQSQAFVPKIERFGVSPDKIALLPNTAPDCFVPIPPRDAPQEAQHFSRQNFNILFAGNIGESQDFDNIVAAAEILKADHTIHWNILGSGRDMARVQQVIMSKALEDRFTFLGRCPENKVPNYLAHADAALISLKDNAIFALTVPYKVQCYMACAKPILASINGEGARIIRESNSGIAVEASSPERLADGARKLAKLDQMDRDRLGLNGRYYFEEHFASQRVFDHLEQILQAAQQQSQSSRD